MTSDEEITRFFISKVLLLHPSFKEIALDKIKDLATRRKENSAHYLIEVDGGINATTGKQCKDAGVDVLVAGSYVFNSDDYTQRITSLK